jgi:hypothetical protein
MPHYRCTFYFEQFKQGWTEIWAINSDSGITDAATKAMNIATQGLVLPRSFDTVLTSFRLSQTDPPGIKSSLRQIVDAPGRKGSALSTNSTPDIGGTAALVIYTMSPAISRVGLLRGLADEDTVRDQDTGQPTPQNGLRQDIINMGTVLQTNGALVQYANPAGAKYPISSAGPATASPAWTAFVVPVGAVPAAGTIVKFGRVPKKNLPWLKGNWKVVEADVAAFSIAFPFSLYSVTTQTPNMYAQAITPLWSAVQSAAFADFRQRKTGRPTQLTHGKARGVRYR